VIILGVNYPLTMGDVLVDSRMIFLREMTVNEESTRVVWV